MARYARIFATIWSDPDFLARTATAQRLYLLLVTQPDVSHCGVLPLTERRWARLALDTDADSVRAALTELQEARFVHVDEATEEVLIRSYMKHDGQWTSPNGLKAIDKARSQVLSKPLSQVITGCLEALSGAPSEGGSGGAASPQQPAASSRDPQPAAAAPPPDRPTTPDAPIIDGAAAAFNEAINLALERRRLATKNIRNDKAWTNSVRPEIEREHGDRIRQLLSRGLTPPAVIAAIYDGTPRRTQADDAKSCARGHVRVGATLHDAYMAAISAYPRQHDAICEELQWWPDLADAIVTPIRGEQA